jgi:hypothetical protein
VQKLWSRSSTFCASAVGFSVVIDIPFHTFCGYGCLSCGKRQPTLKVSDVLDKGRLVAALVWSHCAYCKHPADTHHPSFLVLEIVWVFWPCIHRICVMDVCLPRSTARLTDTFYLHCPVLVVCYTCFVEDSKPSHATSIWASRSLHHNTNLKYVERLPIWYSPLSALGKKSVIIHELANFVTHCLRQKLSNNYNFNISTTKTNVMAF